MKLYCTLISLALFQLSVFAQNEYFDPNQIRYENAEYSPDIKTVRLCPAGSENGYPILLLGKETQLELSFDDLSANQRDLYYTFEHCTYDWLPSNMAYSFYIEGAQYEIINEFNYSINTLQKYIHYKTLIPSENIRFKLSGNYLLKVYEDNDPSKLLLTRRFFVAENKVGIKAQVVRPAGNLRDSHQEIDFMVNLGSLSGNLSRHDFKAVVMQNGRWDKIIQPKPLFANNNELNFDYDDGTISFPAGNEFRSADVRSYRVNALGVRRINQDSALRNIELKTDKLRMFEQYTLLPDFNGQFVIRNFEGQTPDLDSDYLNVDFSVLSDASFFGQSVYLIGNFNNWRISASSRMKFQPEKGVYTQRLLLKQGLYNYCYVFGPSNSTLFDPAILEGNFFNTENDYQIFIYDRAFGTMHDALVGVKVINSITQ